jgi:hypothetical protein
MEHGAISNFCQQTLFLPLTKTHFALVVLLRLLFQVNLGLPFLHFPWGFQWSPCLVMLFWSFLKVCPIHFHFLILISLLIGICCVVSHNSLLLIGFVHHILNMLQRHWVTKVCSLIMISCVVFHVLHPYNNTLITLLLNILSFVLLWFWWLFAHFSLLYNTFCDITLCIR